MENILELYSDYLISSNSQTSATGFSSVLDGEISHDKITRFLKNSQFDNKSLWLSVKSLIREHETEDACLIFDDCITEKQYTDENDIICWHWDHAKGRNVKGVNFITAFYSTQKDIKKESVRLPVMYELISKTISYCVIKTKKETRKSPVTKNELMLKMISQCIVNQLLFKYILGDSWFASTDNMHFIQRQKKLFIFDLQQNRLAVFEKDYPTKPDKKSAWTNINLLELSENVPVKVWLKDMDFPVFLCKQQFKNEEGKLTGERFLISNDLNLNGNDFTTIYKKRWGVEEYHKSLKQNVSLAKSPTQTVKTQSNHFYCAIIAYIKLEKLKLSTKLNHFELKAKIYLKATKAAYQELININKKFSSA